MNDGWNRVHSDNPVVKASINLLVNKSNNGPKNDNVIEGLV